MPQNREAHPIDSLARHREAILAFVLRMTQDAALADDITQETFIRAQRTTKPYRGEAQARSWLCAIALNLVRDHFRAVKRTPQTTADPLVLEHMVSPEDDAQMTILKKEMSACIAEQLELLPQAQSDVVALHDMAGLSHAEIAAHLGISIENARVLLHRGHGALQKILKKNCTLTIGCDEISCERLPAGK